MNTRGVRAGRPRKGVGKVSKQVIPGTMLLLIILAVAAAAAALIGNVP
jgi:hypothetical protein